MSSEDTNANKFLCKTSSDKDKSKAQHSNSSHSKTSLIDPCWKERLIAELPNSSCHLLVEQILQTIGELEYTLIQDHQHDFQLRMALERQSEKVKDLRNSLLNEKERNQRLVQLIRGVDSVSSDEEAEHAMIGHEHFGNSMDTYECISPLLMQQRFVNYINNFH